MHVSSRRAVLCMLVPSRVGGVCGACSCRRVMAGCAVHARADACWGGVRGAPHTRPAGRMLDTPSACDACTAGWGTPPYTTTARCSLYRWIQMLFYLYDNA